MGDHNKLQNEEEIRNDESMQTEESETAQQADSDGDAENVEVIFAEGEETVSNEADTAELLDKIQQLEKLVDEKENRILRLQADFDNYRRRTRNEIELIEKYRSQSLGTALLTSVDNFERALKTEVENEETKSLLQGMEMVYRSILDALKQEGIEPIESVGQEFNPELHHAVMQDYDDSKPSNTVLEEFQKGYKLKDRVIRPAMVKVNQ